MEGRGVKHVPGTHIRVRLLLEPSQKQHQIQTVHLTKKRGHMISPHFTSCKWIGGKKIESPSPEQSPLREKHQRRQRLLVCIWRMWCKGRECKVQNNSPFVPRQTNALPRPQRHAKIRYNNKHLAHEEQAYAHPP